ncbi:MAG: phage head closure protein [Hoeflea sp.]|nr:phage head closure protein [Hoeflea sp.]
MTAMFVDPGRLNARLTLETPPETDDGQGGIAGDWTFIAALWARIEPLRAVSAEVAGADLAPVTHRITIRYRSDVRHAMRFVHRNRGLVIRAVRDPDESRRYLVCDCEENRP